MEIEVFCIKCYGEGVVETLKCRNMSSECCGGCVVPVECECESKSAYMTLEEFEYQTNAVEIDGKYYAELW
jgi:hypothetical protein